MDNNNKLLVNQLSKLLMGGGAHVTLKDALEGLPANLRGARPDKLPYSIWQLLEHIRIAQWDMLQFCIDENHKSPKWPDEYWPKETAPKDDAAWGDAIGQLNSDLDEFIELIGHADLYRPIPGGSGQTILLEALQMADHASYHIGEMVAVRRLLGAWKS